MIQIILKLRQILNRRERRNAVLLFIMILCTGIMEAVGVASIMPFLSVLSNPEVIQENAYLSYSYEFFNFSSSNDFLLFLGAGVFFIEEKMFANRMELSLFEHVEVGLFRYCNQIKHAQKYTICS